MAVVFKDEFPPTLLLRIDKVKMKRYGKEKTHAH
jgi:hypothetical protein